MSWRNMVHNLLWLHKSAHQRINLLVILQGQHISEKEKTNSEIVQKKYSRKEGKFSGYTCPIWNAFCFSLESTYWPTQTKTSEWVSSINMSSVSKSSWEKLKTSVNYKRDGESINNMSNWEVKSLKHQMFIECRISCIPQGFLENHHMNNMKTSDSAMKM